MKLSILFLSYCKTPKQIIMKARLTLLSILSLGFVGLFAQGSIEGNLKDDSGDALSFANVVVKQNGAQISGVSADITGYYFIDMLKEGKYELTVSAVGYQTTTAIIEVKNRETLAFNPTINTGIELKPTIVKHVKETTFFQRDAPNVVVRDAKVFTETKKKALSQILSLEKGTITDKDGNTSFRGSRPGQGAYYVDGMRIAGPLGIPTASIQKLEIYNGGMPARYGNSTSAVIVIETKSVFDYFD